MKHVSLGALALIAFTAVAASAAQAQINPFRGAGPNMGPADMALMDKAASPLFQGETFTPGASANWSNPATGWSGTVRAVGTTKVQGLPCRVLSYGLKLPQDVGTREYEAKWCRAKDGTWKMG